MKALADEDDNEPLRSDEIAFACTICLLAELDNSPSSGNNIQMRARCEGAKLAQ